jgi:hypothetical protein
MNKFDKFLVMPIVVPVTPNTLVIPGTKPLYQQQQAIGGAVRWSVKEWSEAEYKMVQDRINAIKAEGTIEAFTAKLAETVAAILPDRDFSVTVGSFDIEHKAEKTIKKEARK